MATQTEPINWVLIGTLISVLVIPAASGFIVARQRQRKLEAAWLKIDELTVCLDAQMEIQGRKLIHSHKEAIELGDQGLVSEGGIMLDGDMSYRVDGYDPKERVIGLSYYGKAHYQMEPLEAMYYTALIAMVVLSGLSNLITARLWERNLRAARRRNENLIFCMEHQIKMLGRKAVYSCERAHQLAGEGNLEIGDIVFEGDEVYRVQGTNSEKGVLLEQYRGEEV